MDRHRGSVHLFCGIVTSFRGCILDTRWGWHSRLVWQGEARFVTSALLGPPLLQVCLQLPVTFKAQGFKSRGGGALRDFLRYWGLPFLQDFISTVLTVVFVLVCRFKLKFSGAFSIGGSCEFGKETISSMACLDKMFHDRFEA